MYIHASPLQLLFRRNVLVLQTEQSLGAAIYLFFCIYSTCSWTYHFPPACSSQHKGQQQYLLLLLLCLPAKRQLRHGRPAILASKVSCHNILPRMHPQTPSADSFVSACKPNPALGMKINVDFTQGAVDAFVPSGGNPTYDSQGAKFTVAKSGDAPQLTSIFYIMFGRVEFYMKAAPGAGIVSSMVLQSDNLDEIDMEWLGSDDYEVQTNYFGKGITGSYNRGQFNPAKNNQAEFIKYVVDWDPNRIVWTVGSTVVRQMKYDEAEPGQYPQSPMQIKFGAWAGGDPINPQGTVGWARGPTDFSKGPFSMYVRSISVTDYSTGKAYKYGDTSGKWETIISEGGKVYGNQGGAGALTTNAVAAAPTGGSPTVPAGGIGKASSTPVYTGSYDVPDGWRMTPSGKVIPNGSAALSPNFAFVFATVLGAATLALNSMGW